MAKAHFERDRLARNLLPEIGNLFHQFNNFFLVARVS